MSLAEFAAAIAVIRRRHNGSVTSWGRTNKHALAVGGFANDPHSWDRGADMIYDDGPPPFEPLRAEAHSLGLAVIREAGKPHDHYQPLNFQAGPVTEYEGERKVWT